MKIKDIERKRRLSMLQKQRSRTKTKRQYQKMRADQDYLQATTELLVEKETESIWTLDTTKMSCTQKLANIKLRRQCVRLIISEAIRQIIVNFQDLQVREQLWG